MKYDAVVIGAGPGGYVCAIRLAQMGKKVALVEKHKLGGECLNYGCIPSKALIFASSLYDKVKHAGTFGIEAKDVWVNMDRLQSFRAGLISKLNQGIAQLLKVNHVDQIEGEAKFLSNQKIQVGFKKEIEADAFVIATGSQPAQISGFDIDGNFVIGSKEALELYTLPQNMMILGGGVIGLELGTYFSKLGTKITIVEMMDQILPGVDKDLVSVVEKSLKKRGIQILTSVKARGVEKNDKVKVALEVSGQIQQFETDKLLVTVGRKANTQNLDLKKAGVQVDGKGFIEVDDQGMTSAKNIYAIGDVTGGALLAHKASFEGIQVAQKIAEGTKRKKRPISWAIFTDPEIAGVGMSEAEAKAECQEVVVGKFPFMALGRSLAVGETDGFCKVIAEKTTQKLLGVFMVGAHASDLISEAALAVTHGLTLEDLASTIHPHPTLPESLMEACEAAQGQAIHIPNRR